MVYIFTVHINVESFIYKTSALALESRAQQISGLHVTIRRENFIMVSGIVWSNYL